MLPPPPTPPSLVSVFSLLFFSERESRFSECSGKRDVLVPSCSLSSGSALLVPLHPLAIVVESTWNGRRRREQLQDAGSRVSFRFNFVFVLSCRRRRRFFFFSPTNSPPTSTTTTTKTNTHQRPTDDHEDVQRMRSVSLCAPLRGLQPPPPPRATERRWQRRWQEQHCFSFLSFLLFLFFFFLLLLPRRRPGPSHGVSVPWARRNRRSRFPLPFAVAALRRAAARRERGHGRGRRRLGKGAAAAEGVVPSIFSFFFT